MSEIDNNVLFDDSSGSDIMEEERLLDSEQQIYYKYGGGVERDADNNSDAMEIQRTQEKRVREDSEDTVGDDDGFTTVSRKNKRFARILSKKNHNSEKDLSNVNHNSSIVQDDQIIVCITAKEVLLKQFGMAKLLKKEDVNKILKIYYKTPYRVLVYFEDKINAEKLINLSIFKTMGYRCQYANEVNLSYGVIKQIDLETNDEEILSSLECEKEVVTVRRLKRLNNNGEWVNSESVRLCFKSQTLPPYVYIYGCRIKVEPYTFPVTQCSGCWRYGHVLRLCPTKKILCPKCGESHRNCESTNFKCLNCKGAHMALNKSCPMFLKEKAIRKIMCVENCTYRKALSMFVNKKAVCERLDNLRSQSAQLANKPEDNKKTSYRNVLEGGARDSNNMISCSINKNKEYVKEQYARNSPILGENSLTRAENRNPKKESVYIDKQESIAYKSAEARRNTEETGKRNKLSRLKIIMDRFKEICTSNSELDVKIKLICSFVFEECIRVFVTYFKEGDIINSLFACLYNG